MILVKVNSPSGKVLCAVNAVEPSPELFAQVRALEQKEKAQLHFILLGSDWHHLYAKAWADEFRLPIFFAGKRPVRLHAAANFPKIILDKANPVIDGLGIMLISWNGFKGPILNTLPDEMDRCEFSVFDRESACLFIFDIIIPASSQLPDALQGGFVQGLVDKVYGSAPAYWQNNVGFRPSDPALCAASAKTLLSLPVKTIVFSHGDMDRGAIVSGADACQALLHKYLGKFVRAGSM